MAAPKGNRFWEARSSHGRNPIFSSPDELWTACLEYFDWVEENPLKESKVASDRGMPVVLTLPKMRAMTIAGLCIFLDIHLSTWREYAKKQDFTDVVTRAEEIIREQKFAGAAADMLNPNIIARDLGLRDKSDVHLYRSLADILEDSNQHMVDGAKNTGTDGIKRGQS